METNTTPSTPPAAETNAPKPERRPPTVGMRTIKTATAAAICALIYFFFDRSPAFACIGAIFGMGTDMEHSKQLGANRILGTVIGGVLGILSYAAYLLIDPARQHPLLLVPLLYIGVVILILLSQHIWTGAVQPGGVVLCVVLFNTTPDSYVLYALNRMLDTAVGVCMALLINRTLTRERMDAVKYGVLRLFRR